MNRHAGSPERFRNQRLTVLVTGYGGFLGTEIVHQLLRAGHRVRGLGRSTYPHLGDLDIESVRGDVTDVRTVMQATAGVDAVIHTAAKAGVWGDWHSYYSINTQGTLNVLRACKELGVRVLVYCSSPSVTFDGTDQQGIDESAPYPQRWLCHYPHTKALGEQAVLANHHPPRLWTAALRPHLIWGEHDPHLFPRLIDRARSGKLRIVGDGTNLMDTVHVVNAAYAHLCALHTLWDEARADLAGPAGGRAYFITQDVPVNCWDWVATVLDIAGAPPPRKKISFSAAWSLGLALEGAYWLARKKNEPPMTRFVAAQLAKHHFFNIRAAKDLLGYNPLLSEAEGLSRLRAHWSRD